MQAPNMFDAELLKLAGLLRMGAETARTIAAERGRDEARIHRLAGEAEVMAAELEDIVAGTPSKSAQ